MDHSMKFRTPGGNPARTGRRAVAHSASGGRWLALPLLLLLSPLLSAHVKEIRGISITLIAPPGLAEICEEKFEYWQFVNLSTHPSTHLLTCFADNDDWNAGKPTPIYKIEIIKANIEKNIAQADYANVLSDAAATITAANEQIAAEGGGINAAEKELMARAKAEAGVTIPINNSKKEPYKKLASGSLYALYGATLHLEFENRPLEGSHFIATIILKGKILTLKASNPRSDHRFSEITARMQQWIKALIDANN